MSRKKIFAGTGVAVTGAGVVAAILAAVVATEGGYVNHPKDPGGETNHGITAKVARQSGYAGPMRDLSKSQALRIYEEQYVVQSGFLPLVRHQPIVGYKLVDSGINVGPKRAARWFQQSLNALSRGGKDWPLIVVDGALGQQTLDAYVALESKRGKRKACELVIKTLETFQANHYINLNMPDFTVGWIDRRIGNVDYSECIE